MPSGKVLRSSKEGSARGFLPSGFPGEDPGATRSARLPRTSSIPALRVSGGGSRSDEICQITADILGKPVTRVQTYESSSLGAAIAGFLAAGEFHGLREAVNSMVETRDSFFPNPRAKERYDYLYEHAYLRLYPCLKGIYKDIKDFNLKEERERLREEEGE